jgi:hypothetical protein
LGGGDELLDTLQILQVKPPLPDINDSIQSIIVEMGIMVIVTITIRKIIIEINPALYIYIHINHLLLTIIVFLKSFICVDVQGFEMFV